MKRLLCSAALLLLAMGCDKPSSTNNNAPAPATQPSTASPAAPDNAAPAGSENAVPATQPSAPATQPSAAADAKPINKFCAVDTGNPIDATVATVTYKGKVIGFCCEDCIPKFNKDPEKYMASIK